MKRCIKIYTIFKDEWYNGCLQHSNIIESHANIKYAKMSLVKLVDDFKVRPDIYGDVPTKRIDWENNKFSIKDDWDIITEIYIQITKLYC